MSPQTTLHGFALVLIALLPSGFLACHPAPIQGQQKVTGEGDSFVEATGPLGFQADPMSSSLVYEFWMVNDSPYGRVFEWEGIQPSKVSFLSDRNGSLEVAPYSAKAFRIRVQWNPEVSADDPDQGFMVSWRCSAQDLPPRHSEIWVHISGSRASLKSIENQNNAARALLISKYMFVHAHPNINFGDLASDVKTFPKLSSKP